MKIAVVGAGWFGCHLALFLLRAGHSVQIFERGPAIFGGASGANQNRLHLGYHYPRSARTRREITEGFQRFQEVYPTFGVTHNLFGVAHNSWIDLDSYLAIMRAEGLPCELIPQEEFGLQNLQGLLNTAERVIDTESIRGFFQKELGPHTHLSTPARIENGKEVVVNGEVFDRVLDCTGGELGGDSEIFFEPAVLTVFDGPQEHFALTVMDGLFPCLYPTAEKGVWRVSHVHHTARGQFGDFGQARKALKELDPVEITDSMMVAMLEFYPDFARLFHPRFELVKAVRTKLKNFNASREYRIRQEGRLLRVFSGKICSVFLVENEVKSWLKTC